MDFSRFDRLWNWYKHDEAFEVNPRDSNAGIGNSVEHGSTLIIAVAAILIMAAVFAAVLSSEFLALTAVFGSAFILGPLAVDQSRRKNRAFRELRRAISLHETERSVLMHERMEIATRSADLQAKSEKVEKQYQTLRGLVKERSPRKALPDNPDSGKPEELERALEESMTRLRDREAAEEALRRRVSELENARSRAEQELARLMSTSHTRLMTEREVAEAEASIEKARKEARELLTEAEEEARVRAGLLLAQAEEEAQNQARELVAQAEEEALNHAREFVEQTEAEARLHASDLLAQAEEEAGRLSARAKAELETIESQVKLHELADQGDGGKLLREARIQARGLVRSAEEEAERLVAQGKVEFDSILREIQAKEDVEKELYERIQLLEARRLEAEQALHGHGPGSDLARPEAQTAASTPRERSGPAEALRSSFGDFFRRRTRDSS